MQSTPGRRAAPATLSDVARLAGVSISTAGRVLRDAGWPVDQVLKQRVTEAAADLAYVPNALARTLRAGGPAVVGLVIGNTLDPYYGEIAEAITRHAETAHNMMVMISNMQRDPLLEIKYCRRLWEHRVAGLILTGGGFDQFTYHDSIATLLGQMARSNVVLASLSPRGAIKPVFCVDNESVGRLAAEELVMHGHRRVGVLISPVQNATNEARLRGLTAVLQQAGVAFRTFYPDPGKDESVSALQLMFAAEPAVTAVIAGSNMISVQVIHGLHAVGKTVPDDISVVGIGSAKLDVWSTPRLTRVDLHLEACGTAALDYIAAKVCGLPARRTPRFVPTLIAGNSVAPPRSPARPRRRG